MTMEDNYKLFKYNGTIYFCEIKSIDEEFLYVQEGSCYQRIDSRLIAMRLAWEKFPAERFELCNIREAFHEETRRNIIVKRLTEILALP